MNAYHRRLVASVCLPALVLVLVACSSNSQKQPSGIEAAFNGFDRFQGIVARSDPTARAAAASIHDRYRAQFARFQSKAALAKLEPADVELLFRAADVDFFYTVSHASLRDMQLDLVELRQRGAVRNEDDEKVYAAMLESRLFDQARRFANLHPHASVDKVPYVVDNVVHRGPTTLLVRDGGKKLERKPVDLGQGRTIVVVASPLCHFCRRAIRSIEGDAVLRPLFREHALWMVPPDESTSISTVAAWNRLHPNEQMEFAYRREEWPMVERWETPVFYFFKDGRVVSKVAGWPVTGRKAELNRSLRLARLI